MKQTNDNVGCTPIIPKECYGYGWLSMKEKTDHG